MCRILRVCKFATAVALLLASAPATDAQIFSDNFNAGASAQWGNERGNWAAAGGVYDAQSPSNSPITYTSLPFALANFAIELDINDVGDGGVWLRSDAAGDNGVLLVTGGAAGERAAPVAAPRSIGT